MLELTRREINSILQGGGFSRLTVAEEQWIDLILVIRDPKEVDKCKYINVALKIVKKRQSVNLSLPLNIDFFEKIAEINNCTIDTTIDKGKIKDHFTFGISI